MLRGILVCVPVEFMTVRDDVVDIGVLVDVVDIGVLVDVVDMGVRTVLALYGGGGNGGNGNGVR